MADCEDWSNRASRCPMAAEGFEPYHKWIVVGKRKSQTSESATMLMCGICFHEVNTSEAFTHRTCFKSE